MAENFTKISDNLYHQVSSCNTYVLVINGRALVIDPGNGQVFNYLAEIDAVLDLVIVTSHKRAISAGAHAASIPIFVPADEHHIFARNHEYWQNKSLFTFLELDSSFDAPVHSVDCEPLRDSLTWQGITFTIIKTPGITKGAVTVACELDGQRIAFCGGLLCAGGKTWNLFDFQWRYLPGPLFNIWLKSLGTLQNYVPDVIYPAFGPYPAERDSIPLLRKRIRKLKTLMFPQRMPSANKQCTQLLPHLYYIDETTFLLASDSGKGLVVDYGTVNDEHLLHFVKKSIVKTIDRIIITHAHFDHYARAAELKYKSFNNMTPTTETEIWIIEEMADVFKNAPAHYDLPCIIPGGMEVDRVFKHGQSICWEGFDLTLFHHPGQTWYALGLLAHIDGHRVLFTGDNNWPIEGGRTVTPVIFKNILPPSYVPLAEEIRALRPDYMAASHYGMFKVDDFMLDDYVKWAHDLDAAFADISAHAAHRYATDWAFARFHPYYQKVDAGGSFSVTLSVMNHHDTEAEVAVAVGGDVRTMLTPAGGTAEFWFDLRQEPGAGKRAVYTAEVMINGVDFGQVCECIVDTNFCVYN